MSALLALGLVACSDRDADVPVVVVLPDPASGTPVMQGVQSLRLSVRKGTPGATGMKILAKKIFPADAARVSIHGLNGGRDRFVVLEGLDKTPEQLEAGEIPVVLARGSTIPHDDLPGGAEPPADGAYDTAYLFFGRVGEMSPMKSESGLITGRAFFGSAELRDGNVALAGGVGDEGPLSTVEVFHRDGFYFIGTGVMTSPRLHPAMTAIPRQGAVIAGGLRLAAAGTAMNPILSAERLDEDGRPLSVELSMGSPRVFLTAVSVEGPNGENQAVIAGGTTSLDVTEAKRQVERWDGSQFLPYQPLLIARAGLASASLLDGRALLVGGFSLEPFGTGVISKVSDSAERLDTGDTSQPYDLITGMRPHWAHTATRLKFGDVLVAGGSSLSPDVAGIAVATSSADIFLPEFGGFSALPSLATPRAHHASAPLADGRAIVCGGAPIAGARVGEGVTPLGSCELLAPSEEGSGLEWSAGPSLLVPRFGHAMFGLPDGSVLVVGGVGPADAFIFTAEIYTPTWPEPE